jgi:glycosyltransferase involved in cell wall biosynthesis
MEKIIRRRISIIIRVYQRLQDLEICLSTIKKHWTRNDYEIIVVSNGASKGYIIPESCRNLSDHVVELGCNAGHLEGNSQLIIGGLAKLSPESDFVVLLEADTWIFDDAIIDKYINRMQKENAVWASAEWVEKHHSLALDFAIASATFISENPEIFKFSAHAERHVCQHLLQTQQKYIFITECMPTHVPKMMRYFYNPFGGRNRCFIKARMVTHHIEDLPSGITDKMIAANIVLNRREFSISNKTKISVSHAILSIIELIMRITPRSSWIKSKKHYLIKTNHF